jgi:SAM-dependent methyltransferase
VIQEQHTAERVPSGMESVSCLFCAQDDSFPAIQENGFTGRKCRRCGLIYISPRPSRTEVANLYGHDQASISAAAHVAAEYYKRLHARHTLRILRRYAKQGQLLEIGPGAGFFLGEALAAGFQPYGIELNPRQIEFIRAQGIPCSSEAIAEAFPGESFDVIYHCDVLSHLHDPFAEFNAMHRRLRDGGILVFETGNFGDVRVERLSWVPRFQYPDHLFFFSTDNTRELLTRSGFELLKIYRYSLLTDLLRWKLASGIRALRKPHHGTDYGKDDSVLHRSAIKAHVEFLCRYRVGALFPLQNHCQTMIVLARKS